MTEEVSRLFALSKGSGLGASRYVLVIVACLLVSCITPSSAYAEAPNEGYFGYLFEDGGEYPDTWTETRWSDGFRAMTHDEDNWYLAQSGCGWGCGIVADFQCDATSLWRIPVEVDLDTNNQSVWWEYVGGQWLPIKPPGVLEMDLSDVRNTYYKLTWIYDLAFIRKNGQGYLFAKASFESLATGYEYSGLAVINPDTFDLIDVRTGWYDCIAASPDDRLVTINSSSGTAEAWYVSVDWDLLANPGYLEVAIPNPQDPDNVIPIWEPDGSASQGGALSCDISPSGGLLYMVHGGTCAIFNRVEAADLTIGKIVQVSTNSDVGDIGYFDVRYIPSPCDTADGEYMAGITVWDLEADQRAPHIRGRLHIAQVEEDDWELSCTDDVRMTHYMEEVHVIQGSTATPERGTTNLPYNTLAEGIAGAWDYSKLYIWGSNYPETVIFDKKMDVVPLVFTPPYTLTIGE